MDTQDTSPSVLLFFDHQRFIFNAGEVSQIASAQLLLYATFSAALMLTRTAYFSLNVALVISFYRDCRGSVQSIGLGYQRYAEFEALHLPALS